MYKKYLKSDPVPWLLESNPWTRYNTLTNLLGVPANSEEAKGSKKEMERHGLVQQVKKNAGNWFSDACGRHNDPRLSHYQLRILADFGFTVQDREIFELVKNVTKHKQKGLYAIRQQLPQKKFVKVDPRADEWHALPCDSPLITYTLIKLGYKENDVYESLSQIKQFWEKQDKWFCHFFFVEGQYKKYKTGCPMAGLLALEAFSAEKELLGSTFAKNAAHPIFFHDKLKKSIYYFGRSKKFWTMKYPYVWYNALYMADVLSRFPFLHGSDTFKDLIKWIIESQDENGRFKPTSMFMAYKGWDFANKKEPSPWMTYLCCRILNRLTV